MNLGIEGKVAMVAAGSQGIGLACAQALAEAGCRVALCGRSEGKFVAALEEISGEARADVCDVSSLESLEDWFGAVQSEWGSPDIVVTNTGGPPAGKWTETTDDQWLEGVDSTLLNVVRMVRLSAPSMRERGWGRIVHITSVVAREPHELLPISSTLRGGLMNLTRLQARELASDGVTVNSVLPGHTLTDRQRHLAEVRGNAEGISPEEALKKQESAVPVGRLADPREIGDAAAFLCSDRASYITGVNLLVDGGITLGPG